MRTLRRHGFSMITACMLGGALFLGLTSTSFEAGRSSSPVVEAKFTPWPTATPGIVSFSLTPTPPPYLIVYYLVDSKEKQQEVEMALQSDAGLGGTHVEIPGIPTYRKTVVVQSEAEEAGTQEYLDEMAGLAPMEGYHFRVVDMR